MGERVHQTGLASAPAAGDMAALILRRVLTVAWMAVILGIGVQFAVVLGKLLVGGHTPFAQFAADIAQGISWGVIVCAGVSIGTVASRSHAVLMGLLGLVSGPLGWGAAKGIHRGVQGLLGLEPDTVGAFFYLICALKGVEYAVLGAVLGLVAGRSTARARTYALAGTLVGVVAAIFFVTLNYSHALAVGTPMPLPRLVGMSINEVLFPIGCALVIFLAQHVKSHLRVLNASSGSNPGRAADQPASAIPAAAKTESTFSGHKDYEDLILDIKSNYGESNKPPQGPKDLLNGNKAWARKRKEADKEFFHRLSKVQKPQFLWIGCSDSRVPANEIVGLHPGEMFVHRNIANVVPHSDLNCLSVIQYAVEYLGVRHIIVTGHYGCGGVKAAMSHVDHGQIDNWLAHIKDVYSRHFDEISEIDDPALRVERLCELNVITQVRNVAKTSIVQHAWRRGKDLSVHGWIYSLEDGVLRDLGVTISSIDDLHEPYRILK